MTFTAFTSVTNCDIRRFEEAFAGITLVYLVAVAIFAISLRKVRDNFHIKTEFKIGILMWVSIIIAYFIINNRFPLAYFGTPVSELTLPLTLKETGSSTIILFPFGFFLTYVVMIIFPVVKSYFVSPVDLADLDVDEVNKSTGTQLGRKVNVIVNN